MQTRLTAPTSGQPRDMTDTPAHGNNTGGRRFWRPGLLAALGLLTAPVVWAANTPLEMDAVIEQTACTISFHSGSTAGSPLITSLTLPPADSADLTSPNGTCSTTACTDIAHAQPVTLVLGGCGLGLNTTTPTVTLTGIQAKNDDIPKLTGSQPSYAFRNAGAAGGTSRGFYIIVGKKQNMTYAVADLYKVNDAIAMTANGVALKKGDSGQGATSTVWPAVSCGPGCADYRSRAGDLNASLTFAFIYK